MKKIFSYIIYSFYTLIVIGLVLLFIAPPIPSIGALDVKIVKSGSMEPNIMTGAVVVVRETPSYGLNDVITFTSEGASIPTTHRIIGTEMVDGQEYFVTKGDANEERDTNLVSPSDILGKVMVDIPYVGFILDFARQPVGFALLIGLPALLIILDELDNIWRETRRFRKVKVDKDVTEPLVIAPYLPESGDVVRKSIAEIRKNNGMDIKPLVSKKETEVNFQVKTLEKTRTRYSDIRPKLSMATAVFIMLISGYGYLGESLAYPRDVEASADNLLQAEDLDFVVSPSSSSFTILDGLFMNGDTSDLVISGKVGLNYDVNVEFISGNVTLCDDLSVVADAPLPFSGSLAGLGGAGISFTEPWHLDFSLLNSDEYSNGESCVVDIVFAGYFSSTGSDYGYSDIEKVRLVFNIEESQLVVPEASQLLDLNVTETITEPQMEQENEKPEDENTEENSLEEEVVEDSNNIEEEGEDEEEN